MSRPGKAIDPEGKAGVTAGRPSPAGISPSPVKPNRRVSDLVQHFEAGASAAPSPSPPSQSKPLPRGRRISLPAPAPRALDKGRSAAPLAIPATAVASNAVRPRAVSTAEPVAPASSSGATDSHPPERSPNGGVQSAISRQPRQSEPAPIIQRGNLSDLDWTERRPVKTVPAPEIVELKKPVLFGPLAETGAGESAVADDHDDTEVVLPTGSTSRVRGALPQEKNPGERNSHHSTAAAANHAAPDVELKHVSSKAEPATTPPLPKGAVFLSRDHVEAPAKGDGLPQYASRIPSLKTTISRGSVCSDATLTDAKNSNKPTATLTDRYSLHDIHKARGVDLDDSIDDIVPMLGRSQTGQDGQPAFNPLPACKVFSRDSLPLRLHALDAHLSDRRVFSPPKFTCSDVICSEAERELFQLGSKAAEYGSDPSEPLRGGKKYSAAGRQLRLPKDAVEDDHSNHQARRRRGWPRKGRGGFKEIASDDIEDDYDEEVKIGGSSPVKMDPIKPPSPYLPMFSDTPTVASKSSTDSHPITRTQMFPPLMLLQTSSLRELKSNAVGPRAPRTGVLALLPGVNSVLGSILDTLLGIEGSSFAANLFRLEVLRDFAQLMRANLTFQDQIPTDVGRVQKFLFYTLPSFLALDFVSIFGMAIIWLLVWMGIIAIVLLWFWRLSSSYDPNRNVHGYEGQPYIFRSSKRGNKALNVFLTFVLTSLYMPLSKMALDTLLWSSDYWAVSDPYQGGNVRNPTPPPLGDSNTYRDPLDFCYTTTMRKDEFNYAWVIVPAAGLTILVYTILWPLYLAKVIRTMRPNVSKYNELGVKRTAVEMDREYERQLGHDKSPLNYLYNGYNRRFSSYKPFYLMFFKLSTLVILSIFTRNNCLFKQQTAVHMVVIQQGALIGLQVVLLCIHIFTRPFVDVVSNRAELVGRVTFVITATIGLLVALRVRGSDIWRSVIMWIIQGFSYTSSIYYTIVSTNVVLHLIKRFQRRIDFSIDIYSPLLDFEKHVKRRVWEETLSIILLTGKEYRMPVGCVTAFSASEKWPPYLLFFRGTPAERHLENLMVLKEIGLEEYKAQVGAMQSAEGKHLQDIIAMIQKHYAGPDSYFRPAYPPFPQGVTSFFGKAFVVPFPPTLVFRYDQQQEESFTLTTLDEFKLFLHQNQSAYVQDRKQVRLHLRALDGQKIICPFRVEQGRHFETKPQRFSRFPLSNRRRRGNRAKSKLISVPIIYNEGVLSVQIKEFVPWETYNFASGFEVFVTFTHGQRMDPAGATWVKEVVKVSAAEAFGLMDTFTMTHQLAKLFYDNEHILRYRLPEMQDLLRRYRMWFFEEAQRKRDTLSYSFLTEVFDDSLFPPDGISQAFKASSKNPQVQTLPRRYPACISSLYERLTAIRRSQVHTFWYLFWDDLYRQNSSDYKILQCHKRNNNKYFDPRFPSSIAYRPMSRGDLEAFLQERGAWVDNGRKGILHRGLLNRLYFCLNRIVFAPRACYGGGGNAGDEDKQDPGWTANEIPVGVSTSNKPTDIRPYHPAEDHYHAQTQDSSPDLGDGSWETKESTRTLKRSHDPPPASAVNTLGTGGGTSSLRSTIPNRPAWTWEQRFDGRPARSVARRIANGVLEFLNIRPFLIHRETDGNLWIWVREVDGDHLEVVRPGAF